MNVSRARALVLAGGKGTRLAAAVPDRPKILAPIGHEPFLDILIAQLRRQGFSQLVFLLGDRAEPIVTALRRVGGLHIETSIEPEPMGTAGAVKHARRFCTEDFFLLNGDTYLELDAAGLLAAHERTAALVTIAAAQVPDASRFGSLDVGDDGRLLRFREKRASSGAGLINGGVYVMSPRVLDRIPEGRAVSLETEVFPALLSAGERVTVVPQQGDFFDIGTEASWKDFARYLQHRSASARGSGD